MAGKVSTISPVSNWKCRIQASGIQTKHSNCTVFRSVCKVECN